jgi:hypothetical protein
MSHTVALQLPLSHVKLMEPLGMYPSLQESEHWPPLGMGVLHVPLPPLVGTASPRVTSLPAPLTGLISVHSARSGCMSVLQRLLRVQDAPGKAREPSL